MNTTTTIERDSRDAYLQITEQRFYAKGLPPRMWGAMKRYLEHGCIPGHFLSAVICNDLADAVARADDENVHLLKEYVLFLYNDVPSGAWGSRKKFDHWVQCDGLRGGAEQ